MHLISWKHPRGRETIINFQVASYAYGYFPARRSEKIELLNTDFNKQHGHFSR
jgi:hypothetical protein